MVVPNRVAKFKPTISQRDNNRAALTQCSEATLKLAEADLARSGLTLEQALADGIFPTDNASSIHPDFASAPAIIIRYYDSNGQPLTYTRDGRLQLFCRTRYLTPPGFRIPRGRKYDQPNDSGTPPYFPRRFDAQAVGQGKLREICCVEGEKKAIALCRAGIPTFAIGGVWNFADGSAPLHPALAGIAENCADLYIVFDSDILKNAKIAEAEWRLIGQAALLGVRVHPVRIPPSDETDASGKPKKVGADDFLVAHGARALAKLILNTPAVGQALADAPSDDEITVAEILRRDVAPVEELISGWVEKGIPTFIAGPGGVHKSRLALQWGLCLNASASVWSLDAALSGLRAPKATLVYCAAEDDSNELARRAQAICAALKLKSQPHGVFIARKGQDSALVVMHEESRVEVRPFYHRLVNRLRSIPSHKIVVLDSAYDFVRFAGRAKIDEDSVNYFIKVILQGICDQTDSTILIPWHPSQAGSGRKEMDGWSVAWHNAARGRIAVSAMDGAEDTYEIEVVKRNHARKGDPLKLKFHDGALLPLDAVPEDGKTAAIHAACVDAAVSAARMGVPLTRQRNISPEIVTIIAMKAGVSLTSKRIKDELEAACHRGEMHYQKGYGKLKAGYFPGPQPVEVGAGTVETGVETPLRPDVETE